MRRDSRLFVALHALLHMADEERMRTSEEMGTLLHINPVVMRRTMGGLRAAGIVTAVKGHGGGWSLGRPLAQVTVADVYEALGDPSLFGVGPRTDNPGCIVEQVVNRALTEALDEARAAVMTRLRRVSVADLARDWKKRASHRPTKGGHTHV